MKLHLGCGSNHLDDWINVDLDNPEADVNLDLRLPLPFDDASIRFIYNEHFIEHISADEGRQFLRECWRVLRPQGCLRISTPDLKMLIKRYEDGNITEWVDVGWQPSTPCRLLNEGMRNWGHQFVYDELELSKVLRQAGFSEIIRCDYRISPHPELHNLESRPWHQEVILEARK